ncbi:hypothetical protein FKX85_17980 [Echinicola soli]|uniref:Uncharacterized protein n=1 Tax=Echinicola soli TaxID=2591634 RepID=A0A514CLY3_9BACT|nr:hypothetical protein [Echinicola soli]QDH80829.1 hypothetical protein FKX85_17980 [Echinicola soli]
MALPILLVIGGCNEAEKSTYSRTLPPESIDIFDYDKHFLRIYESLMSSEFQDMMAHNMAFRELEQKTDIAIKNGQSFAYETNFHSTLLAEHF